MRFLKLAMRRGLVPGACLVLLALAEPAQAGVDAVATTSEAPAAAGFSLAEALAALDRHPQLVSAQATGRAAAHDVVAAGVWTNPQINIQYARSLGYTTYDPLLGAGQIGVTQFLETSGLPTARRRAAEFERDATHADTGATRTRLALEVRRAFLALAGAFERRNVVAGTLVQVERARGIVEARVAGGLAPRYHASRMAIAVADARAAVEEAEAQIATERGAFDVAVGPGASALLGAPKMDLYESSSLPSLSSFLDAAKNHNAEVNAMQLRARAAAAEVDIAQRSVFPGIAVYGGLGVGQGIGPNNERQYDVLVGVTVPIPSLDRGQGRIPAARMRAQAWSSAADGLTLEVDQRVRAEHAAASRRRVALEKYRESALASSAAMVGEIEAAYSDGRLAVLELVDAYTSARDAKLRFVDLAVDAKIAEVAVWQAAGVAP
ncbi:TolC family protein [Polyangium fumosum]|uniref:TolC family protein n=1 Tax=Polyangium fumosum TaxID=889272 RepID=A0A4U1IV57_9BACT|nr:TolC family protein [Polyangium fumosum]TKC98316.1 TolC family protein [Polyangium fumosum]